MESKKLVKSFVKEFMAKVSGDSAKATAEKVLRQADSALQTHIAVETGNTISLEDALEAAKERLHAAKLNNGSVIDDRDAYVESIINAKNALTLAEEALENHYEKLHFLKETHESLGNTEEEETEN